MIGPLCHTLIANAPVLQAGSTLQQFLVQAKIPTELLTVLFGFFLMVTLVNEIQYVLAVHFNRKAYVYLRCVFTSHS